MFKTSFNISPAGLPILRINMPSIKSVTVLTLINTGSRYEPSKKYGIAHFFEHMVFKGTTKYPTADKLAATIDGVGADFNAFTSREYTGYYVKAAANHFDLALDVVSDLLLAPKLRQKDIDREKSVIVEELNMYFDNPIRHVGNMFDQMFFVGSGLSHDVIGSKESINGMLASDFKKFLHNWYGLSNMVLVLAGDSKTLSDPKILEKITQTFDSKLKTTDKRNANRQDVSSYLVSELPTKNNLVLETRKTAQAHFILGWPGLKRGHPDRYVLSILSTILGGNMSSRLFNEIREKRGLCYYISSGVEQYHDSGVFEVSAGVDPKRIDEALAATIKECQQIADQTRSIGKVELQKGKDYIAGKIALGFESSHSVAEFYGLKQLLLERIETPEEVLKQIDQVSLADLHRVATQIFKGQPKLALIGPFKDKKKFLKYITN